MDALTQMPEAITAGTLVKYQRSFSDFPADQGWALAVYLRGKGTANATANANGSAFDVTLSASASAALPPGSYIWTERVTKATEVYDVASGLVTVLLNPATAGAGDSQTWEEKTLALVETAITALSTGGVESYQVGTRAVTKIQLPELKKFRGELIGVVRMQRNGGRAGRQHLVTFRSAQRWLGPGSKWGLFP